MKNLRQWCCVVGILLGIAITIFGNNVRKPEVYMIGEADMAFNGDFYTEMYDVTQDVGGAVNRSIKDICNAIGWLIMAVGMTDIAYFLMKLACLTCEPAAKEAAIQEKDQRSNSGEAQTHEPVQTAMTCPVCGTSQPFAEYCIGCGAKLN